MPDPESKNTAEPADTQMESTAADDTAPENEKRPKEVGGRGGLDPTRYGDWEKAGRCIDF